MMRERALDDLVTAFRATDLVPAPMVGEIVAGIR
jgi:hypothetical protein